MKKKIILATVLSTILALTGCGAGAGAGSDAGNTPAGSEITSGVVTEDVNSDAPAEVSEGELDDSELEGQMLTPGNTSELVGVWYETDCLDSRTLTISPDETFELVFPGGGALRGHIEITEETNPDDTVSYWYTFYDEGGDVWESLAIPDEGIVDDLYFGQSGDPHFISEASLGIKYGADYPSSGGGVTSDYFIGTWQNERTSITIEEGADGFLATVVWADSASVSNIWEYYCEFDPSSETLECPGTGRHYTSDMGSGTEEITEIYTDGSASFELNYGALWWFDEKSELGGALSFEKISE